MKYFLEIWYFLLHFSLIGYCFCNVNPRILELNDRFLDVKKDGNWLVMFYAPWCAHCRRLEPIWSHVQQTLHNTNIRVCRMDCVTHKNACSSFRIHSYPTIMFIKGDEDLQFIYHGDRQAEDIVHFSLRVSQPPIRPIKDREYMTNLEKDGRIFFTFTGDPDGEFWDAFSTIATKFQPHSYFFHVPLKTAEEHFPEFHKPSVSVRKDGVTYHFEKNPNERLNVSLTRWVNEERFPIFVKITRFNIHTLMETKKYLVMAVVEENKVQDIPPHMEEFKNMIESVIKNNRKRFHNTFQFGWIGSPDLANSIAIKKVPLPYLLVLNPSTNYHHIPDDEPHQLTPEAIAIFLESVENRTAKAYGGNGFFTSIYRLYFEIFTSLAEMWKGNPILTSVLIGLPMGFLSLICYSICCADIMDAEEDDFDDDSDHEKKE